jgi:hypothetical protein
MIGMAFPMSLDRNAADGTQFTAVFDFSDPGISPFTIRVANGEATAEPGHAEGADLELKLSAEAFEKTFRGITAFPAAMQAGEIRANDIEALIKFGTLFPMG